MFPLHTLLICLFLSSAGTFAQKPVVSAVVWDDKAWEGKDHGEIRI